ncbi:MAG TPA: hypothetical protein PKE47_09800 [Verrucomicrobiota bacterium]|nr:hypothetical protein [Verrucomicrobiota bacterium]
MPVPENLAVFTAWCRDHVTGDEKGQAQIFLDRLFRAFGQPGCLGAGGSAEFRIRRDREDGGSTAYADHVRKPVVLVEMKRRGTDLRKHHRQAFDCWTSLVPTARAMSSSATPTSSASMTSTPTSMHPRTPSR